MNRLHFPGRSPKPTFRPSGSHLRFTKSLARVSATTGFVLGLALLTAGAEPHAANRRDVGHPVAGVVALILDNALPNDPYQGQFCAGVLVARRSVLTAAHCVQARNAASLDVIVGADNLCRGRPIDGDRVDVTAVAVHPGYRRDTGQYDLAELTLARDVAVAGVTITEELASGSATSFGWGLRTPGTASACRLQEVSLTIPAQETCATLLGPGERTFDARTMVCAVPNGADNTCYGDSGGPLVVAGDRGPGQVIGIVSWGRGCTGTGVYARAASWFVGPRLSEPP